MKEIFQPNEFVSVRCLTQISEMRNRAKVSKVHLADKRLKMVIANHVNKAFFEKQVLRDVSFHIKEGERVGVIGLNGSGKTTLMRILMGALRADSGYVRVAGEKPWERQGKRKKRIGFVSALSSNLHPDRTVEDSVNLCRKMYPEAWKASESDLEIVDYVKERLKIKDVWKEVRSSLSLGEGMRAEFLYAVMMNPHLLIMDEPTTGMDYEMRMKEYECLEYFRQCKKDMPVTVLLVTHSIQEMERLCDRVIAIHHGQIIFDGAMEYLQQRYLSLGKICFETEEGVLHFHDMPVKKYEIDGKRVQIIFDKRYVSANIILQQLMEETEIKKIRFFDMDMETIIRNLYQENQRLLSKQ